MTADHILRKEILCPKSLVELIVWSIQEGSKVEKGQVIGKTGTIELGNQIQLFSPCKGTFCPIKFETEEIETKKKENEETVIGYVDYCIHPLKKGRVCMMCLQTVTEEEEMDHEKKSVKIVSNGQVLHVNMNHAVKLDHENISRQLRNKKLSLILDLDHTLLHAARVADLLGGIPETDDLHRFYIPGIFMEHIVKLRPGLNQFLSQLTSLYDLHIYTHGTRKYAEVIAKIIDPEQKFFRDRIVARTDTPDVAHKSLKLLFPSCDDSMILVLDDRIDVWHENPDNVMLIEPYHFFTSSAEINNASGRSMIQIGSLDAEDKKADEHLTVAMNVLKDIHEKFYADGYATSAEEQVGTESDKRRDVKRIIVNRRREVLKGCNVVFSGVFPHDGRPQESHHIWKVVTSLGAVAGLSLKGFPITHLIIHPLRLRTPKHLEVQAMEGVHIVTPEWVFECALSWAKVKEENYTPEQWQRKAEARQKQKEAAAASVRDETIKKVQSTQSLESTSSVALEGDTIAKSSEGAESKPSSPEEDNVVKPTKEKKSVRFDVEEAKIESPTQNVVKRTKRATMTTRPIVSARNVEQPARIPDRKGIVASGGSFDFLNKLTRISSNTRGQRKESDIVKVVKKQQDQTNQKQAKAKEKDMDDAFLKLIEAEEKESEMETKRKLESDDVKDVLIKRRMKQAKTKETVVYGNEDSASDSEDALLNELEEDILSAF